MLRKNLMSAVYAAVAAGAVLVVYNAFMHGNVSQANTASSRLSTYLGLDKAKQEAKSDEDNVVGTDNGATTPATTPDTSTTQTAPATTTTPATDQGSTAATSTTGAATPATQVTGKAATTYTVKDGDTYGCIAEKYYGSYENFVDVMAANPVYDQGFGEYQLYVGAQLTLPAVAQENVKPASSLCQ